MKTLIIVLSVLILFVVACTDPVSIEPVPTPVVEKIEQIQVFTGWDLRDLQDSVNLFLSFLEPEDIIEIIHNVRNVYYQGDLHPQHSIVVRYLRIP